MCVHLLDGTAIFFKKNRVEKRLAGIVKRSIRPGCLSNLPSPRLEGGFNFNFRMIMIRKGRARVTERSLSGREKGDEG